jgi:hypothetical protein
MTGCKGRRRSDASKGLNNGENQQRMFGLIDMQSFESTVSAARNQMFHDQLYPQK